MQTSNSIVGKIYSVACRDFVTYDEAVLFPGEYLNVILGPNGTGKSTLVAAIILAMGGSPKVLSRSSDLESYIKNGKQVAWIQVKLFKNQRREIISFERSFDMRGKSTWKIDGRTVDGKQYLRGVGAFNIQIDNLCQFLPQDRVQDFAKMNSHEILMSTLNSICDPYLIEKFDSLRQLRSQQLNSKKLLLEDQQKLKEFEQRNEELKEKIEQMKERNKYMDEIEVCLKKRAWLECDQIKKDVKNVRKDLDQAFSYVERDQKNYDQVEEKTRGINEYIKKIEKELERDKNLARKYSEELDQLLTKNEELDRSIREAKAELAAKKAEEEEKGAEVMNAVKVLEAVFQDYQNAVKNYGTEEQIQSKSGDFERQSEGISLEIRKLLDKRHDLNRRLDEDFEPELQAVKRRIFSIENVQERRLNMLRDNFEHVYKAVVWLRQNRQLFEGRIYEPMILELNVNNANNAKYFENTVNMRDLLAFTCVNKSDLNLLIRKLCNEQGLEISAIHSEEASECHFKAKDPIDNYRKYGFYSYLIDMVDGPAPILNYLCKIYNIEKILVGSEKVNEYADELPQHITFFYTAQYRYSISYSKYSSEKSSMRVGISSKNILCMSIDHQELNKLKERLKQITSQSDRLKNERTEIEAKISFFEEKRNNILTEKKALDTRRHRLLHYRDQLRSQKVKVEKLKNQKIDIQEEEAKFKEFAARVVNQILANQRINVERLKVYQECIAVGEYKSTKLQIFKQQHADLESMERSLAEALENSQNLARSVTKQFEKLEKKYRDKLTEAMDMCGGKKITATNFPYKDAFSRYPSNIQSLNEHIDELQSRLECLGAENQGIIEDFEQRKATIESLKEAIKSMSSGYENLESQITEIHLEWYPKVMEIVEQINQNFTRFMTTMQYAGEVQLVRNGDHEYDSYGMQILVQYRDNAKLQVLDRFVQSGGERAVAIAVYTLSLQHLTNVPFRCVDEINQGMDPRNERKIFELLVEETSREGQPQYFFISPKLLPNLKYNALMNVHIVFNGKSIADHQVFSR